MTTDLNKTIPEFETNRLYMRAVTLEDSETYEKNFADYEVIQHLSHVVPWPFPKGGVKDFLEKTIIPELGTKRWLWVIFLKENKNEVIGCVDLWLEGKPENRGFWLAKKHWGKSLMTEAVEPVMDFAFNKLGFVVDGLFYRSFTPKPMKRDEDFAIVEGPFDKYTAEDIKKYAKTNFEYFNSEN